MIIERIKRRKRLYAVIISIVIIASIFSWYNERQLNYIGKHYLRKMKLPENNDRVLVFAPHCDDEALAACELIKKTINNGGKVKIVVVTNGDGFTDAIEVDYLKLWLKPEDYIQFGYTRQKESIRALEALGVDKNNIIFLGYPDGGMAYLWNNNWDKSNPYTSRFTKNYKNPYKNCYDKNSVYSGENVISDITEIIKEFKPTHIIYPHPNDRHPDHWATNGFVKYALTIMEYKPKKEWLYLVHRGDWPTPMRKEKDLYLVPPLKLVFKGTEWITLDLSNSEIEEKEKVIHMYKTQINILRPLMTAFERKNEMYGEYKNLKLVSGKRHDSDVKPCNENEVIRDPLNDTIYLDFRKETDISNIYAEMSSDNKLHIFIKIDGSISSKVLYNLNLIFFKENGTSRLSLGIKDNKLQVYKLSSQSIINSNGIDFITGKNDIHIIIPKDIVGDFSHVFINSHSELHNHVMDKSAWRILDSK